MCGPIALALPYSGSSRASAFAQALSYNLGRSVTYAMLGGLFGLLGQGVFLAGYQSGLSIFLGAMLLLIALFSIPVESQLLRFPPLQRATAWLQDRLGRLLRIQSRPEFFRVGLLNGLLPCGLVYMAAVGAVATGNLLMGMAYMGIFGLGTLPLMLTTALAGNWISLSWRRRLRRLTPVLLLLMGALLIARGLQFELPSNFSIWEESSTMPVCH
jgi:sulfite exporter TauE/SafE